MASMPSKRCHCQAWTNGTFNTHQISPSLRDYTHTEVRMGMRTGRRVLCVMLAFTVGVGEALLSSRCLASRQSTDPFTRFAVV